MKDGGEGEGEKKRGTDGKGKGEASKSTTIDYGAGGVTERYTFLWVSRPPRSE